ncbi:hypothetical protein [Sinomonas sp. B1-1]|uniref:hypothetical protein n=1 Tax=Sinomonas sp. B1-1 TaxID=3141454 RepID=UPI003D2958A6
MDGAQNTDGLVAVRAAANHQLAHAGDVVGPGGTIRVPGNVAEAWFINGWAEPADPDARQAEAAALPESGTEPNPDEAPKPPKPGRRATTIQ